MSNGPPLSPPKTPPLVNELWHCKYKPSLSTLAIHPSKINLILSPGILFLHGPPGSGKSSLLYALAASRNVEIVEYDHGDFERFVLNASRFTNQWYVVKHLQSSGIDAALAAFLACKSTNLLVFIHSHQFLHCSITQSPKYSSVFFPPISKTQMTRVVKRVCALERIEPAPALIQKIVANSNGDVRSCLLNLQFACLAKDHVCFGYVQNSLFAFLENMCFKKSSTKIPASKTATPADTLQDSLNYEYRLLSPYLFEHSVHFLEKSAVYQVADIASLSDVMEDIGYSAVMWVLAIKQHLSDIDVNRSFTRPPLVDIREKILQLQQSNSTGLTTKDFAMQYSLIQKTGSLLPKPLNMADYMNALKSQAGWAGLELEDDPIED
jgi:DNA polymerase III delta prime subunit